MPEGRGLRAERVMNFSRNACLMSTSVLAQHLTTISIPTVQLSAHPFASTTRIAAVLVPILSDGNGEPLLLFTKRSSKLKTHPGEISFPGGSQDTIDTTLFDTALREASEEIGLSPARTTFLTQLSPVCTIVSNFVSTPFVVTVQGSIDEIAPQINHDEVENIIIVPLAHLADPSHVRIEQRTRNGLSYIIHFYTFESHTIWGATGRIISELIHVLPA